jgi:hypothetical protein
MMFFLFMNECEDRGATNSASTALLLSSWQQLSNTAEKSAVVKMLHVLLDFGGGLE